MARPPAPTPPHKCSKSATSAGRELRKCWVTAGDALQDMAGTMSDMKDTIQVITNPTPSSLLDKHTPVIKAIKENEYLSLDNFGDIMMLLTDNHEVGSVYLAIDDSEQRTCYLQKQLKHYRKTMWLGVGREIKKRHFIM